ncbi:hypothetical protein [Defluviicoccus vanus]|uniref:Uncharacterized protein n=1 Tax=Defluviicoccus vanus TaxID=111831 RepID=A0A7H1N3M5_9PROT|nr:hypothetical protein [Defluviicoccus vanus]QNT70311.1 hypothetical protein HQ394_14440 [Defluviicoccus vanus]
MFRRAPRYAFWLAGAAIAFGGALAARLLADGVLAAYRVPVWITGCVFIFIGLAIVSLGNRQRREGDGDDKDDLGHAKTDAEQTGRRSTLISELRAYRRRRSGDGMGGTEDSR